MPISCCGNSRNVTHISSKLGAGPSSKCLGIDAVDLRKPYSANAFEQFFYPDDIGFLLLLSCTQVTCFPIFDRRWEGILVRPHHTSTVRDSMIDSES